MRLCKNSAAAARTDELGPGEALESDGAFLHLTGRASVVTDHARLKELYTPVQRAWFPDGLDDPNMTLIRFDADKGNYWDKHDSMLRLLGAFTTAAVTGSPGKSGNAGVANLP